MLSNPVSTYSQQVNIIQTSSDSVNLVRETEDINYSVNSTNHVATTAVNSESARISKSREVETDLVSSLARTFVNNVLADPNTCGSSSGLSSYVLGSHRDNIEGENT